MNEFLFPVPQTPSIAVMGQALRYPVVRIFCVGRNYAAHAAEMGAEVDREAPFYFTKSAQAYQPSGTEIPYPPGTGNFHFEMEFVLTIGKPVFRADLQEALTAIHSVGCGLDMTRRDLQQEGKDKRRPWDIGKDVEHSAVFSDLTLIEDFGDIGPQKIHLEVNGETRQEAILGDMIWKANEIVSHLSTLYHLRPGDVIMTGTPAGVGAVVPGDKITGGIDGLAEISLAIGPAES